VDDPARSGGATDASPPRRVPPIAVIMPSILIVDSYIDEAEMYAQYLRSRGADIDHVRRPEDALARALGAPPAVVIADMVFKWSAYDAPRFVRALRNRPECARTRFIVLSGYTARTDRRRAQLAGADRFVLKPCAPDKLWRLIATVIRTRDHEGPRSASDWPGHEPARPDRTRRPRRRSRHASGAVAGGPSI
jgi:CheY-like chemotaxis protein